MRRLAWMVCLGVFVGAVSAPHAQIPENPSPAPISPDDWPTFRTGTRLATIDAVVVDKDGRHVTDLTPADFEVVERGITPKVRQAVYVRVGEGASPIPAGPPDRAATAAGAPVAGPPRYRPLATAGVAGAKAGTSRVIAIVVDDLGLSFESTASVRRML